MHKSQTGEEFWNKVKNDIISRYKNGESLNSIAKSYSCYGTTIGYKLNEWGIQRHERYNNKYKLRYRYFERINNEHKAYWYGLLLSDGHVNKNGIMLCIKEEYLLEQFKNDLDTDIPIKYNSYNLPMLNIASRYMSWTLLQKGFTHRKSYYMNFEKILCNVPDHLLHHFVRGMFDGDGSIKYYKYDFQKTAFLHFGYTGIKDVVDYIVNLFNIPNKVVKESDYTYTTVSSNPQKIKEIYDYLYKDATIYMKRKKETFETIFQIRKECYN